MKSFPALILLFNLIAWKGALGYDYGEDEYNDDVTTKEMISPSNAFAPAKKGTKKDEQKSTTQVDDIVQRVQSSTKIKSVHLKKTPTTTSSYHPSVEKVTPEERGDGYSISLPINPTFVPASMKFSTGLKVTTDNNPNQNINDTVVKTPCLQNEVPIESSSSDVLFWLCIFIFVTNVVIFLAQVANAVLNRKRHRDLIMSLTQQASLSKQISLHQSVLKSLQEIRLEEAEEKSVDTEEEDNGVVVWDDNSQHGCHTATPIVVVHKLSESLEIFEALDEAFHACSETENQRNYKEDIHV